jgi:hypothetical protein
MTDDILLNGIEIHICGIGVVVPPKIDDKIKEEGEK